LLQPIDLPNLGSDFLYLRLYTDGLVENKLTSKTLLTKVHYERYIIKKYI
jgi:hypothetical protein